MIAARIGVAAAILIAGAAHAQSPETLVWLRKMYEASQKLSYDGTFVFLQGKRSETSRITRYGAGDIERLEVLDGHPREIVRTRDTLRCYLPAVKVVKVERRVAADRHFPALLPGEVEALARHYDISLGESRRIAGFDCQAVLFTPKDKLRYGYKLYADSGSGMLLKAVTVDTNGETIEEINFTRLSIGNVTREMVRPRHSVGTWRIENAEATPAHLGWILTSELPGFRKVVEVKRRLGDSRTAGHLVYSDGLAAVSVFIEPLDAARRAGLASVGAVHTYTREVANHMITVVGEAPAVSVQRIANAVEYRGPQ